MKVEQEAFAIITTSDLTVFDEQSMLASEGAATSRLKQMVTADPSLEGKLQVVPAFEVAS